MTRRSIIFACAGATLATGALAQTAPPIWSGVGASGAPRPGPPGDAPVGGAPPGYAAADPRDEVIRRLQSLAAAQAREIGLLKAALARSQPHQP